MNLTHHVPEYIRTLAPYVPGKPIEETQREYNLRRVVKLASNENPLGPSPKAIQAVKKVISEMHRYPDGSAFALKKRLASTLDVTPSSLIIGNGSNEVIDFLIRTYCLPGNAIVTSEAAFVAYKLCAQIQGVRTLEAPMTEHLEFDLDAILELARKNESVRMVFIANPNNPTGTYVNRAALEAFFDELSKVRNGTVLVVLDYAYWEYVSSPDLPDPIQLMKQFVHRLNIVVLKTFSKVYGLAGFRVGYGVGSPEVVSHLEKVRQPFNVNALGLVAAEAALDDEAFVLKSRKVNQQGLTYWQSELEQMSVPYWKSEGNFLLANIQQGFGMSGPDLYQACLRKGVIFRPVANYGLPGALRISVGTPEENRIAVRILRECTGKSLKNFQKNSKKKS